MSACSRSGARRGPAWPAVRDAPCSGTALVGPRVVGQLEAWQSFIARIRWLLDQCRTRRLTGHPYLDWLGYANAGMLHRGNLYAFDYVIRRLSAAATVLEIGSFCGLSTSALTFLLGVHGRQARLFTCDAWVFQGAELGPTVPGSRIRHAEYRTFCRDAFLRNVGFFSRGRLPHTIEASSERFFQQWAGGETVKDVFGERVPLGGPFDFVYIDGDHSEAGAQHDFEQTDRWLVPGGYLLFDDSGATAPFGCRRIAQAAARHPGYRLIGRWPNVLLQKRGHDGRPGASSWPQTSCPAERAFGHRSRGIGPLERALATT